MSDGPGDAFDALYDRTDDPWKTATRWYERRKLDLVMAMLPRERFASAYDGGCGNGILAGRLATRVDRLVASDANQRAVRLARERLAPCRHVEVARHRLPDDYPDERFELVVFSEVVYFLSTAAIDALALRLHDDAKPKDAKGHEAKGHEAKGHEAKGNEAKGNEAKGNEAKPADADRPMVVMACDWRADIEGWGHRGDEAHRRFGEQLALPTAGEYRDDDMMITMWSCDERSVAMRDGLR